MTAPSVLSTAAMVQQGTGTTCAVAAPPSLVEGRLVIEAEVTNSNVLATPTSGFNLAQQERDAGGYPALMLAYKRVVADSTPGPQDPANCSMATGASLAQNCGQAWQMQNELSTGNPFGTFNTNHIAAAATTAPVSLTGVPAGDLLLLLIALGNTRLCAAPSGSWARISDNLGGGSNLHAFVMEAPDDADHLYDTGSLACAISGGSNPTSRAFLTTIKKQPSLVVPSVAVGGAIKPGFSFDAPVGGVLKPGVELGVAVGGAVKPLG